MNDHLIRTFARWENRRLAELLTRTALDASRSARGESDDDAGARLLELTEAWHFRALIAQNAILREPPKSSSVIRAGSFLDPCIDELSTRLEFMTRGVGGRFRAEFDFRMDDDFFAQVRWLNTREYSIEIGLKLVVQLFLGAISLAQPGSKTSAVFPDPFQPKYGPGAADVFESQKPLLQVLSGSAFEPFLPEENWRRLLAYELFSKGMEFALRHEFGHAVRGHLEFLAEHGAPAVRTESGDHSNSISPLTSQLLEVQADDTASIPMIAKWGRLSHEHDYSAGPRMLGRFGFSITQPEHAHLILGYAVALLFFVIDAEDRGAMLVGGACDKNENARDPSYPSPGYRLWRFDQFQRSGSVDSVALFSILECVRDDLHADHFPHANSSFEGQLNIEDIHVYNQSLIRHCRETDEGRALMRHEVEYGKLFRSSRLPTRLPRFWGEASSSIFDAMKRVFGFGG